MSAQSAQKQPDGRAYGVRGALQLTPEAALMARERSHPELSPGPIVCVFGASVSPSVTAQEGVRGTERKHPKPKLTKGTVRAPGL